MTQQRIDLMHPLIRQCRFCYRGSKSNYLQNNGTFDPNETSSQNSFAAYCASHPEETTFSLTQPDGNTYECKLTGVCGSGAMATCYKARIGLIVKLQ